MHFGTFSVVRDSYFMFLNVVSCIALRDRAQYAYGNCVIVGTTRVSLNMLKVETRLLYNRL